MLFILQLTRNADSMHDEPINEYHGQVSMMFAGIILATRNRTRPLQVYEVSATLTGLVGISVKTLMESNLSSLVILFDRV